MIPRTIERHAPYLTLLSSVTWWLFSHLFVSLLVVGIGLGVALFALQGGFESFTYVFDFLTVVFSTFPTVSLVASGGFVIVTSLMVYVGYRMVVIPNVPEIEVDVSRVHSWVRGLALGMVGIVVGVFMLDVVVNVVGFSVIGVGFLVVAFLFDLVLDGIVDTTWFGGVVQWLIRFSGVSVLGGFWFGIPLLIVGGLGVMLLSLGLLEVRLEKSEMFESEVSDEAWGLATQLYNEVSKTRDIPTDDVERADKEKWYDFE